MNLIFFTHYSTKQDTFRDSSKGQNRELTIAGISIGAFVGIAAACTCILGSLVIAFKSKFPYGLIARTIYQSNVTTHFEKLRTLKKNFKVR